MSLKDLLDSCQSVALAAKLWPDETAIWNRYCREFSKRFFVSLTETHKLAPEFIFTELFSDYLNEWEPENRIEDILDMIGSLSSPEYNIAKEKALREELKKIEEDEEKRIEENRPIHESLIPKKFGESTSGNNQSTLPKSGGINMDLIRKLQNQDKEG